jgi:hypothetical protein
MKRKVTVHESKSLKTLYLYALVVLTLIGISLAIKSFYIFQESKFNSAHDFTVALIQQKSVKEIVAFHPETPSISILSMQSKIPYDALTQEYGIATDGYIQTQDSVGIETNLTTFLWSSLLHTASWQSNLTVFDKIKLLLLSKNVTTNNKTTNEINLSNQTTDTNTIIVTALTDQNLASENISIQIINATGVSGLGQRLERVLTNMGANIVDVSSTDKEQKKTTIAYFGNDSYTLDRLKKFFGISATKLSKQTIADIIITIGNDKRNTKEF